MKDLYLNKNSNDSNLHKLLLLGDSLTTFYCVMEKHCHCHWSNALMVRGGRNHIKRDKTSKYMIT